MPVERLDGDEGFAEVFFDDVFVADTDVLGEPEQGWRVAMATTGSERGLTLRAPGRFLATAQRLIDLYREEVHTADPALRDRLVTAYIDAEAYRWQTFQTVTRIVDGGDPGAESSMVKLFWSELDVRLHEMALELLGPHAELVDGDFAAWMKGYEFALAGPIYAGTNEIQRNVVAERVLGLPRAMRFAFDDEQLAFRDAVRDLLDKECAPARLREAWTNESGRVPGLWAQLVEMGVVGMLAPQAAGGLGLSEVDLVLLLEETGRHAVPEPIVETAAVAVPLLAAAGDARLADVATGADVAAVGPLDEYAVWADTTRFLLIFDDDDAHLLEATAATREPRASVDGARRLSWIDADLGDATRVGATGAARSRVEPGCARRRRPAVRARGPHARPHRGLRQGAPPVRRPDRLVPGGEAPPRERARRSRVRPPARLPGGVVPARTADAERRRPRLDGEDPGRRGRPHHRPRRAAMPRRDRLHHRVRPAPLHETHVGTGPDLGRRRLAPQPGRKRDPVTTPDGRGTRASLNHQYGGPTTHQGGMR